MQSQWLSGTVHTPSEAKCVRWKGKQQHQRGFFFASAAFHAHELGDGLSEDGNLLPNRHNLSQIVLGPRGMSRAEHVIV
jgi:hypothetical protein